MFKEKNLPKIAANIIFNKKEPVSLVHFVTNRCNARCSFCFIDFDSPNIFENELTLNEINSLTRSFGKLLMNVNLTGGEPFARKDLADIAKLYIKNSSIQSIYITTNGSLPDRVSNFIDEVHDYNKKIELSFQISIDDFPENHNKIRKIDDLFNKSLDTYNLIRNKNISNINSHVAITVSKENCDNIENIYNFLFNDQKIKHLSCILVRDEGVYKSAKEDKLKILKAYNFLKEKIISDQKKFRVNNHNNKSILGKLHKNKDLISYQLTSLIAEQNKYISPCHASSLFGVIGAKGDVYPCEILKEKCIGNLRDYNMNFKKLWDNETNKNNVDFILKTKCFCTYECATSFNILGNWRYYPKLFKFF